MVSLLYHVSAADQLGSTMQSAVQKSFPRFIRLVRGPSQCPISSVVKLTGANLCPGVPSVDKISSASPRSLSSSPLRSMCDQSAKPRWVNGWERMRILEETRQDRRSTATTPVSRKRGNRVQRAQADRSVHARVLRVPSWRSSTTLAGKTPPPINACRRAARLN